MHYPYVIVGGGAAAASAIEGIRAHDARGPILLVSRENHAPYRRPPLSRGLWTGETTLEALPIHPDDCYEGQGVTLALRREAVELDPTSRTVWDDRGTSYTYDRLLLATGGRPRLLDAEIMATGEVHYYRSLEDFLALRASLERLQHALVIGGGFVGVEMAAAIRQYGREVSLVYRGEYPLRRTLPRELGLRVAERLREGGVETVSNDAVASLEEAHGLLHATTRQGNVISTQMALVGVGLMPYTDLAEAAGLSVDYGIEVDEYAQTSDPNIFAAGDVAEFPYLALGRRARIEHWDHAVMHGRVAGENMAGARTPYDHLPFFDSGIFDIAFEGVGEVDPALDVDLVWTAEGREAVAFYCQDDVPRGVLLWNLPGLLDWARDLIRSGQPMNHEERERSIPAARTGR